MIIKFVKKKDVLINQKKDIIIETNTIFRFKSFIKYKNKRIELYDYSRTIIKKRIISIYIKKDNCNKIEL